MRRFLFVFIFLATRAYSEPMTFEDQWSGGNCAGCSWIAASGEITADTPEAFRQFMGDRDRLYLYETVTFDSPGGNLGAAIELGRLLRKAGASVSVGRSEPMKDLPHLEERVPGGRCESACVFAFLGGAARWVEAGELGIHQFYTPDGTNIPTAATQQIMGQIVMYLIEMGISPELLTLASRIPGDRLHHLSADEIARLGIGTSAGETPMRLGIADGGLVLRWEAMNDDGSVDRHQSLRCSSARKSWMLDVLDTGIGENNGVPQPGSRASTMRLRLGETELTMPWDSITALGAEGEDYRITVQLPLDLREFTGRELEFTTNDMTNFSRVLSISGTVPDAATLDALVRACGT